MKKLLDQLLKDNYTKQEALDQIRLITSGVEAKGSNLPENKASPGEDNLITPDIIGKLPTVTITLAVSLPKEDIQQLGRWFRQNADPQVLLDIHKDPQIVGGCRVIWQGVEGDFSLRKKFRND